MDTFKATEPPFVARPRPPRSRSGRLGLSQSTNRDSSANIAALNACPPAAEDDGSKTARWDAAHLALIGALDTFTPPATPPMDNCVSLIQSSQGELTHGTSALGAFCSGDPDISMSFSKHARENSRAEDGRSPEELASMLEEARKIIQERERGMSRSITAVRLFIWVSS